MKSVLLIEPGTKISTYPPIGLLHLASAIRKEYNVKIKDYSGKEINEKEINSIIKRLKPLAIGLRVLTGPSIPRAILISKIAKKNGILVIWGGPHPTILPEQTLKNKNIDAVCIGEGEYTLKELLKFFEGKTKNISGAGIKINKKIKIFPPQKKFINFENLPLPAWDLLEALDRYFPNKKNVLPISTTRGCIFKCGFCHNSNKNVKCYLGPYRIAPPERAVEELEFLQKLIKNKIDFLDVGEDLHLISEEYSTNFCKAIKNSKIKNIKWSTSARLTTINKKVIDEISSNGCKKILLGIESGSKRIQKINGKFIDLKKAINICKYLRKKGIFVTNSYIFGHPTETKEELEQTIKFIKNIPADENLIQLYRPMPGTPYFELCLNEGKINKVPRKLEDWTNFGTLGNDTNVSRIPDSFLFSSFYKINLIEQTKYIFHQQKFFLKNKMYKQFFANIFYNRFTYKLREILNKK